jgi:hypothetical protein
VDHNVETATASSAKVVIWPVGLSQPVQTCEWIEVHLGRKEARAKLKTSYCNKCNQPIAQEVWTRKSLDTMAEQAEAGLGQEGTC